MQKGPVITLIAGALATGWFAPNLTTMASGGGPAGSDTASQSVGRLDVERQAQWSAGQTVLARQQDGHFYADGNVEGGRVHFLVDTGASLVALTGEDAASIGLTWDDANLRIIGRGASGEVRGVPVRLDHLEIEGIEARGIDAAIIPEGLDVSLLGQTFLSRVQNVEISGDEMRLGG